uniref:Uncharacterized protein n=1 Tax=Rhizophora mucronata TaxID=61149 RepID=A0A2P2QZM0_RHIMU
MGSQTSHLISPLLPSYGPSALELVPTKTCFS